MAVNLLRGRPSMGGRSRKPKPDAPPLSIGEPDAHVFMCPRCSRPLSNGTTRCSGCGQRLILGVAIKRASLLMGTGLAVGVALGAVLTTGVITSAIHSAAQAVTTISLPALPTAAPTAVPTTAPTPVLPAPTAAPLLPAAAQSALTQTTLLDQRIADDAAILETAYKTNAPASDIARALRLLAADAAVGSDQLDGLQGWAPAADLVTARDTWYGSISTTAANGLASSVSNQKAYRSAASAMLRVLRGLPAIDTQQRTLAATVELTLPALDAGVLAAT